MLTNVNNRVQFTLQLTIKAVVDLIREENIRVNEDAQRSINPSGKVRLSTNDIIELGKLGQAKRIKDYASFLKNQILTKLVEDPNATLQAGFAGTIHMTCSNGSKNVTFNETVFPIDTITYELGILRDALSDTSTKLGLLTLNPSPGETLFHIVDGQGRFLVWFFLQQDIREKVTKTKDLINKVAKSGNDKEKEKELLIDLEELQKLQNVIINYMATNSIAILLTANSISDENVIVGLNNKEERQAYVEGNQLNSQASLEEALRFDGTKMVLDSIRTLRNDSSPTSWMSEQAIESYKKSIAKNSTKVHTISGLTQAYSFSGTGKRISPVKLNSEDDKLIEARLDFVNEYWKSSITDAFGNHWYPEEKLDPENVDDLREYLDNQRFVVRDISFQGLFLQALGRLGYYLGEKFDWDKSKLAKFSLDNISPTNFDYHAFDPVSKVWKEEFKDYSSPSQSDPEKRIFQNTAPNIDNMFAKLKDLLGETKE